MKIHKKEHLSGRFFYYIVYISSGILLNILNKALYISTTLIRLLQTTMSDIAG